jgi:hypothetical protein
MIDLKVFEKFETENHLLPFSASRLKSYKNNKAKFFLDYVLGYPRISNFKMIRGLAVEFAVNKLFQKNEEKWKDVEVGQNYVSIAQTYFKSSSSFLDENEDKQKQYDMIEPMVKQILKAFLPFLLPKFLETTKLQYKITTEIGGVPFQGFCDYVFEDEDTIYIVDLKTKDKFMLTNDDKLQMAIYKKAYQEKTNKNIDCSFLLATGKEPRRKDQKVCEFVPFIPDYDYIGEAETHLKSLEHTLKLANSIDDLKVLFAPKLDDYEWKDPDAKKNRQEVWGI